MIRYYIVVTIIFATSRYANGQSCNTLNGNEGECLSIFNCKSLLTLLKKKNITLDEVALLKKSHCGYDDKAPKVCCPKTCSTPEGKSGECISIFSCPHLADMLRSPVLHHNELYVKQSRCKSADQYSVCCESRPILPTMSKCEATVSAFPPDPDTECCGRTTYSKLLNGPISYIDQFPWLVIIEYKQQLQTKLYCGGALISRKYVLTAAHCVTGDILEHSSPKNIRLGEFNIANEGKDCVMENYGVDCTDGAISIPIERIILHPDYSPKLRRNDIALIRMKQTAPLTDFIRPICLPTSDITLSPPDYFTLQVSGWGLSNMHSTSDQNQYVDLPYQSLEKCRAAYNKSLELWDGQICAGTQPGRDSCCGDSGGPLMYQNHRNVEILGITSFRATPCTKTDIPGVYTKVFKYIDWIKNTIEP